MQFSNIVSFGSLLVLASASLRVQEVTVTCSDAAPSTIYQTVTVTSTVHDNAGSNQQYTTATSTLSTHSLVASTSTSSSSSHATNSVVATASSTISIAAKATHSVIVGANGELLFGPNQLNAATGDIIRFDFNSTNHTVTQSSFNAPCSPLEGGFNTAFHQVNKLNHTGVIFVDFEVSVGTPLWFYCAQTVKASHCHKGMVLGVNPAEKFPAFLSMATTTATATMPLVTGGSNVVMNTAGTNGKTLVVMGTVVSKSSNAASGTVYKAPAKPTVSAYRFKGRQAAAWYN